MTCSLFGSRSVTAHLLRGVIAAALVAWAVLNRLSHPGLALVAGVAAVIAMRGCPMCWTVGLFETIAERLRVRT
jgi:O-antigen ligase